MKTIKTILLAVVLLFAGTVHAGVRITIKNITKGQPLTPPVILASQGVSSIFKVGTKASKGLRELAEDGKTDTLVRELRANKPSASRIVVGNGLILPGESTTIEIKGKIKNISLVSMLARTNDAFIGFKKFLKDSKGFPIRGTFLAAVYDAGTETNTEQCRHIPAPPCEGSGRSTGGAEGFIHPHPGIQNIGDLNPLRDAFSPRGAALITIH